MTKTICAFGALALLLSMPVQAKEPSTSAGTNFPALTDYPAVACTKPASLPRKPITTNPAEIGRYNDLIANYNKAGKTYVECVNAYVGNANRDMDIIRQKSRAATDEANRSN